MEWRDQGVLLSSRRHGESAAIIEVFTETHGRHAGVVRGGGGRKLAPLLQPGAQLEVTWRARLEDHLGAYTIEPLHSRADLLGARDTLAGLNAVVTLLSRVLPERETHPRLYQQTQSLLDVMATNPLWPMAYLSWEMSLLEDLGYGLDVSSCAVTGSLDDLVYVSPKSGRAVSTEGAGAWADRLLPLVPEMLGAGRGSRKSVLEGLQTTGYFLHHWVAPALGDRPLPEARARLLKTLGRNAEEPS